MCTAWSGRSDRIPVHIICAWKWNSCTKAIKSRKRPRSPLLNSENIEMSSKSAARLAKLQELKKKAVLHFPHHLLVSNRSLTLSKAESEELNRKEVFAEHERKQFTVRDEIRTARKRKEAETLMAKQEAEDKGDDFQRQDLLRFTAEEVEEWESKRKKREKNADRGFGDWAEANLRKHKKLTAKIQPDLEEYAEAKAINSSVSSKELLYRGANSLAYGDVLENRPTDDALTRMADDIKKQLATRKNHSRRRAHDDTAAVTYINDKNMRFNQKLSRVYDKYTEEIKQNLERGTAL
eukprot:Partr_v1_DN26900_c0_g1_i1_m40730 putative SYF2 homolog, RNA splicing factor (S. cerevisiae)